MHDKDYQPPEMVFWMIWVGILTGFIMIQMFVGGGFPSSEPSAEKLSSGLLIATMSGAILSTIIRWLILPKFSDPQRLLPMMIVGIALAELTGMLGMFIIGEEFPSEKKLSFIVALVTIIQYMPFYAPKSNGFTK